MLFSTIFLKSERLTRRTIAGALLAVSGVVLLVGA
jgi:drug/metabolite transporter (DMT)-like permease